MRIALLTDGIYPYVIGGMQKHSYYLAKYLAQSKVYVDIYHTNQSRYDIEKLEFFSEEEKQYIRSFVIPFPKLDPFPGHYLRESFAYSCQIFEVFSKNANVDFVYAKGFAAWKLLVEKRKGFQCAPVGLNFHGYEMFQPPPSLKARLHHLLLRRSVLFNVHHADFLFSYGGKITDIILGLGVEDKRIIEIPAGIERSWLVPVIKPVEGRLKFLFVGRYERRKGVEELTEVLKELLKEYDFEMQFIGPIPFDKQLSDTRIIYHGKISDEAEMKRLIGRCDVLVCPSYSEGMPNVIAEAMASGLAVIATDVGAVSLMVTPMAGWLIPPASADALKNAFVKAMEAGNRLNEMKKTAQKLVMEKFLWENIIHNILNKVKHIALSD